MKNVFIVVLNKFHFLADMLVGGCNCNKDEDLRSTMNFNDLHEPIEGHSSSEDIRKDVSNVAGENVKCHQAEHECLYKDEANGSRSNRVDLLKKGAKRR